MLKKNVVMYYVYYKGYEDSEKESRVWLQQQVPKMVDTYERKHKVKVGRTSRGKVNLSYDNQSAREGE